jgi:hypothetical protein
MRLDADKAFRSLMAANNITLQSALITAPVAAVPAVEVKPVAVPATSPAPAQVPYLIPIVIAAILLLVGAGFALRRRTVGHPTM